MTAGNGPGSCPRCGARVEPGQEYCLECGLRLPAGGAAGAVGSAWRRRVGRREWLLPILAALLVAVVMTGLAIAVSSSDEAEGGFIDATTTQSISVPTTESVPTEPTTTAETETEPATTETEPAPPPPPQIVEWPPSQNGYTVVIASLPASGGRAVAIRKAREALRSGLTDVGVIDSGEFSSLHPGYYVVFSGIYPNQRDALAGIGRVQRLYPAAYMRQISR